MQTQYKRTYSGRGGNPAGVRRPGRLPALDQLALATRHRVHCQRTLTQPTMEQFRAFLDRVTQRAVADAAQARQTAERTAKVFADASSGANDLGSF